MTLKEAISQVLKVTKLRKIVRDFDIQSDNLRNRNSLAESVKKSRKVTKRELLEYLTETEVKLVCELIGVDSTGRRKVLIERLIEPGKRKESKARQTSGSRVKSSYNVADLKFGNSTDQAGFTPAGIAAFSDLRSAAVIRELVQNSLDAALIEAHEPCAHVIFSQSTCQLDQIPGIESYRRTFQLAVEQQSPSGSAISVVRRIERTLEQDDHNLLCVIDNGIGLDGIRMSALLSDGVSAKGGSSSGTFGNGHSVVVPASNLRYILYGGLTANGESYCAGQAVLASHREEKNWRSPNKSGRGLFLKSLEPDSSTVPYTLIRDSSIPALVGKAINQIRREFGHGAAVIVPAFNGFESSSSLCELVCKASAFNFFQAIHENRLVVEVEDKNESVKLDSSTIETVLSNHRDEQRLMRTGAFLSGRKANDAYETLVNGESHYVSTEQGEVLIRLLRKSTGRRSVGLCRNGMWITDNLPILSNAFNDRQPFEALILLSSDTMSPFFELIQEAETPLHDKLALKQLDQTHKFALRSAFREIRNAINELIPASTAEVYSPDDILAFQFDDAASRGKGGRRPSYWGEVKSTPRSTSIRRKKGTKGKGTRRRGGRGNRAERITSEDAFRLVSVPLGEAQRLIQLDCMADLQGAALRIYVDENVDATCDRQTRSQSAAVSLSNVVIDGKQVNQGMLLRNHEGLSTGIRLGDLEANSKHVIEISYQISESDISVLPGQEPALRMEVLSESLANPSGDDRHAAVG